MKHLKKFEEQTFDDQIEITDLKQGDYVIVNCTDLNIHNEILQLRINPMENDSDGVSGFTIKAGRPGGDRYDNNTFFDYEIVKKLTPDEVEEMKYNL